MVKSSILKNHADCKISISERITPTKRSTAVRTTTTTTTTLTTTTTTSTTARPLIDNIVCTFDELSVINREICGGLGFNTIPGTALTGLQLDNLPSFTSTYITDFTSLSRKLIVSE